MQSATVVSMPVISGTPTVVPVPVVRPVMMPIYGGCAYRPYGGYGYYDDCDYGLFGRGYGGYGHHGGLFGHSYYDCYDDYDYGLFGGGYRGYGGYGGYRPYGGYGYTYGTGLGVGLTAEIDSSDRELMYGYTGGPNTRLSPNYGQGTKTESSKYKPWLIGGGVICGLIVVAGIIGLIVYFVI